MNKQQKVIYQFNVYYKKSFRWRCYLSNDDITFVYVNLNVASVTLAIQTLQAGSENGCGE